MIKHIIAHSHTALIHNLRQKITQDTAEVLGSHIIRLILGTISSAILARGLGPASFSVFAVISAARMIAGTLADFGLHRSAIRYIAGDLTHDPPQAHRTATAYTRLKLLGAFAITVLIILLANPIATGLNLAGPTAVWWVWLGGLVLFTAALNAVITTILHALRRFRALIVVQSTNIALTVLLAAALWLTDQLTISWALGIGSITAVLSAAIGYGLLPADWRQSLWASIPLRSPTSKQLWSFSKWLWVSALMSILAVQLDLLVANIWLAPHLVGIYALARNLALKTEILNQTLHVVLLPTVSALSGQAAYRTYIRQTLLRGLALAGLVVIALPLARPFILLVYGADYAPAIDIFFILMIEGLFNLIITPIYLLVLPMNIPHLTALTEGIQIILIILLGALLIPYGGIYGLIAAKLLAKIMGAGIMGTVLFIRLRHMPPETAISHLSN